MQHERQGSQRPPVGRSTASGARRTRVLKLLLGLVVLVQFSAPLRGHAQGGPGSFWTGNDLLAACTGSDEANRNRCTGYVMAIVDVLAQARNEPTPARACVPFNIDQRRVLEITVGYLQNNPEQRRQFGSALTAAALTAAFPCP